MSHLCHAPSWWLWTTFYPLFLIHKNYGIALLLHLDVGSMSQEIQCKAKQHAHVREVFSSLSGVSAHEVRVHADKFLLRPCSFHSQASVSSPLSSPSPRTWQYLMEGPRVRVWDHRHFFLPSFLSNYSITRATDLQTVHKIQVWSYLFKALRIECS